MFTQILHKILCISVQLRMVTLSEFCSLFATVQMHSKIGNSLCQQVEICTADITPILLLNDALSACKIL
jgi:hypothetical protein